MPSFFRKLLRSHKHSKGPVEDEVVVPSTPASPSPSSPSSSPSPPSKKPSDPADLSALIDAALRDYTQQTKTDLRNHPLSVKLKDCDTPDAVIDAILETFDDPDSDEGQFTKFLNPIVNVLHVLSTSGTISGAVGLAFPPATAIFSAVGVLLTAVKDVSATYDALIDLFGSIRNFLDRLKIYAAIPSNPDMTRIVVKTMTEVLSILALATKQVKENRLKTYGKMLLGDKRVLDALQKLDRLTREEAQMTGAQILKVTHDLMSNMKTIMGDGDASMDGIGKTLDDLQQTVKQMANEIKRDQLQERIRNWLSPPDPSVNHNIACDARHEKTASWLIESSEFEDWKANGSLMWIHGKPGSGKSVLCSSIIEDVQRLRGIELASVAYFYFDFRTDTKQNLRGLLSSLLAQLSAQSNEYRDILYRLYKEYDSGSRQPSDGVLIDYLKKMLALSGQGATYIVIDALDECPDTELPSPRERVLKLIKEVIDSGFPDVRICVTSRPEPDIHGVLEPLAHFIFPLHMQGGQAQDIADYIHFVINSEPKMQKWKAEERDLAIYTLTEKADGMFRWVYCQLETLRNCLRRNILSTLESLPDSLDGTYKRILEGIHGKRREYAHRMFQFLAVSTRPLLVEELADVLAFDFEAQSGPEFEEYSREENPEEALLSTCSTMIIITHLGRYQFSGDDDDDNDGNDDNDDNDDVDSHEGTRIVQFAHFSVQEFLTSNRLEALGTSVAHYRITTRAAHLLLAQTCLGLLLQFGTSINKRHIKNLPLARYAADFWDSHARFEDQPPHIKSAMETLFDPDQPYFSTWVWLRDEDEYWRFTNSEDPQQPASTSLYYSALCGFPQLTGHLATLHPDSINSLGGKCGNALHAASTEGYFQVVQVLLQCGADVNAQGGHYGHALQAAAHKGSLEIVKFLLQNGATVNTPGGYYGGAIQAAAYHGSLEIVEFLLENGADIGAHDGAFGSALQAAGVCGSLDVVEILIARGADPNAQGGHYGNALQAAAFNGSVEVLEFLLQHGADINGQGGYFGNALQAAVARGFLETAKFLLDKGADVNASGGSYGNALIAATASGDVETLEYLLQRGADVNAQCGRYGTALQTARVHGYDYISQVLLDHGATTM